MRIIAVGESDLSLLARNKYRRRSKTAVCRLSERVGFNTVRSIVAAHAWSAFAARFALTNSPHFRLCRTAHCADIWLVCHVGTWVRIPPAHSAKNENTLLGGCFIFGGAFHFVSEPRFIFVSSIFGCVFPRNRLPSRASV